ncbi:hypothetical protein pb186bvf_001620 [Paramecium bursaria]
MDIEQQMLRIFEKSLKNDVSERMGKIIVHQQKIIQTHRNPAPKLTDNTQIVNMQKKLSALERNMLSETQRKRRYSKIEVQRSKTNSIYESSNRTPTQFDDSNELSEINDEVTVLKKENARLQEKIVQLEMQERETRSKLTQQTDVLKREQQRLIDIKKRYQEDEQQLQKKLDEISKREIQVNNIQIQLLSKNNSLEKWSKQLENQEKQFNQKKNDASDMLSRLDKSMMQMLSFNKSELRERIQQQLGIQLEAVEMLIQSTMKERSVIQQEQVYLRQLKEAINEEKREMLKLKCL